MAGIRTFVAIPLPAELRADLAEFARSLSFPAAAWEEEEKLHLTLRFIGDIDPLILPRVLDALDGAARTSGPFTMVVEGIGFFPSPRRPRVLWAGCNDPTGTLAALRGALDERLTALGVAPDDKAFHPHVTLARFRGDGVRSHLTSGMKSRTFVAHRTLITEIFLMKSVLRPGGSEHTLIGSSRLSRGGL